MPFALRDVGLECFTLVFRDEDIGAVFSTEDEDAKAWTVALHDSRFDRSSALPAPFTSRSHRFVDLHDIRDWLGIGAKAAPASGAGA